MTHSGNKINDVDYTHKHNYVKMRCHARMSLSERDTYQISRTLFMAQSDKQVPSISQDRQVYHTNYHKTVTVTVAVLSVSVL